MIRVRASLLRTFSTRCCVAGEEDIGTFDGSDVGQGVDKDNFVEFDSYAIARFSASSTSTSSSL
jgi:hypothetical protein